MTSVRVYYAAIPARNTNMEKKLVLDYFHAGVPLGQSVQVTHPDWQPSDLAVMQGWVHDNSGRTPHLMFRRKIIEQQRAIGKHTLAIDSNLFLYRDPGNTKTYLRFSLDDVFPTTGNYFTDFVDPSRWQQIRRDIGFDLQPWSTKGKYILIALQRNGGWAMGGKDVMQWCKETIDTIRQYSDREIIVRAHPGDRRAKDYLRLNYPKVKISNNASLVQDFKNCWCVITYNSSPGVAAAIEGIPVFVTDPEPQKSQAFDVCNVDLSQIENPQHLERQQWVERLAMSHYNFDDLRSGRAWEVIKKYL
jgi:hypothetical protein